MTIEQTVFSMNGTFISGQKVATPISFWALAVQRRKEKNYVYA